MPRFNGTVPMDDPDGRIAAHLRSYGSADRYLTSVQDYLPFLVQGQPNGDNGVQQQAHTAVLQQLQHRTPKLMSGADLLVAVEAARMLPIGCNSLDAVLYGGLRETTVMELSGETCSGKTQLCHLAAITTALRGERVVYIDSTNGFSAARASRLLAAANYGADEAVAAALSNITVVACHNIYGLLTSLDELVQQAAVSDASARPTLLVVDSISALLSPVIGATQHYQGHVLVAETGRLLRHIADSLKLAVLVTNHVVGTGGSFGRGPVAAREDAAAAGPSGSARLGPGGMNYSYKPALGEQWRSLPHIRVQLSRATAGTGDLVCATLLTHSIREPGHQAWLRLGDIIEDAEPPA